MDENSERLPDPIQWDQGILLTPRHFLDLAGRYEMLQQRMSTVEPFSWGVLRFSYDKAGIADGRIEVVELEAVMPDGAYIAASAGDIPPLSLKKDDAPAEQTIYLTLPEDPRFSWKGSSARFEPCASTDKGAIGRLKPILRLQSETPSSRFVSIPLLRLEYSTAFVNRYEPPWLNIPAGSPLLDICAKVVSLLRNKVGFLAAQIKNPAQALTGVPELRDKLRCLVSGLPVLEAHLAAGRAMSVDQRFGHPWTLYLALCSTAGHVSLLSPDLAPPEFAAYDHADLLTCYTRVADYIQMAVDHGVSEHWAPYRMNEVAGGFELPPQEALARYDTQGAHWPSVVIGLRVGPAQTRQTTLDWAERCIIATGDVSAKRENRVRGAGRRVWEDPPDLTPPAGVMLFAIEKGDTSLHLDETLHLVGDAPLPVEALLYVRQIKSKKG